MKKYELTLAANAQQVVHCGDFSHIRVMAATGDIEIKVGSRPYRDFDRNVSVPIKEGFSTFVVHDLSGASNAVEIQVSDREISDDRNVINNAVATENASATAEAVADVACGATGWTKLLDADNDRVEAHIFLENVGGEQRWSGQDETTAKGCKVNTGVPFIITVKSAIWLYTDTALDAYITVTKKA